MLFYIDPGTGSMLFTILIGVLGAAVYALREVYMKFRFRLNGGKTEILSGSETPIVIFTDSKRYWNVFEPICRSFEEKKVELLYLTMSPDDPALREKYPTSSEDRLSLMMYVRIVPASSSRKAMC